MHVRIHVNLAILIDSASAFGLQQTTVAQSIFDYPTNISIRIRTEKPLYTVGDPIVMWIREKNEGSSVVLHINYVSPKHCPPERFSHDPEPQPIWFRLVFRLCGAARTPVDLLVNVNRTRTPDWPRLAGFTTLFAAVAFAAETNMPDFSRYELQTLQPNWFKDPIKEIEHEHATGQFMSFYMMRRFHPSDTQRRMKEPAKHEDLLLGVTVFFGGDTRCTLRYIVTPTGVVFDCRHIYNGAFQAGHDQQLSEKQLADLKAAIKALPVKNAYPPLAELAIVSFRTETGWVTHTMPTAELTRIYAIIGERFETKKGRNPGS